MKKTVMTLIISATVWALFLAGCGSSTADTSSVTADPAATTSESVDTLDENEIPTSLDESSDDSEGESDDTAISVSPSTAKTAEEARMSLVPYNDGYPEDTVVISAVPTEALYLHGGDGGYIPEDQDKWKELIHKATEHLEPFEYDVMPWSDSLPISISWVRGDIHDAYVLGKDGSLWGYHSYSDDSDYRISPENAKELADQIKEVYDFLKIDPVSPDQIKDLVSAELVVDNKSYPITDTDKLDTLSGLLSSAAFTPATGCDRNLLNLETSDGKRFQIAISADGCGIWQSDGYYYDFGSTHVNEIYSMFGVPSPNDLS